MDWLDRISSDMREWYDAHEGILSSHAHVANAADGFAETPFFRDTVLDDGTAQVMYAGEPEGYITFSDGELEGDTWLLDGELRQQPVHTEDSVPALDDTDTTSTPHQDDIILYSDQKNGIIDTFEVPIDFASAEPNMSAVNELSREAARVLEGYPSGTIMIEPGLPLHAVWEQANEYFTHHPEHGDDKAWGDGRYEWFEYDGNVPGTIQWETNKPRRGVGFSPKGVAGVHYAKARARFHHEGRAKGYKDRIHTALTENDWTFFTIADKDVRANNFPALLGTYHIEPDDMSEIPAVHREAAAVIQTAYDTYIDAVTDDLADAEYCERVLDTPWMYETEDGELLELLEDEDFAYKIPAQRYISEFPNLVKDGVHDAFRLSETLHARTPPLEE